MPSSASLRGRVHSAFFIAAVITGRGSGAGAAHALTPAPTSSATAPQSDRIIVSCPCVSERRPLPDGCRQRPFVEIVKLAADRHAVGRSEERREGNEARGGR